MVLKLPVAKSSNKAVFLCIHFRMDIDYANVFAQTVYGKIGIKVWICKGEVLTKRDLNPNFVGGKSDGGERRERRDDRHDRRDDRRGGGGERRGGGGGGGRRNSGSADLGRAVLKEIN